MNKMAIAHQLARIYKSFARETDNLTYRDYLSIALKEVYKKLKQVIKYIKRQRRTALVSKILPKSIVYKLAL